MKQKQIEETGTCSLCGKPYEHWGNNPEPIKRLHERCCDQCNHEKVIPARMYPVKLPYGLARAIYEALPEGRKVKPLLAEALVASYCALGTWEEQKTLMEKARAQWGEADETT